jgi:hypothetical protein
MKALFFVLALVLAFPGQASAGIWWLDGYLWNDRQPDIVSITDETGRDDLLGYSTDCYKWRGWNCSVQPK